MNKNVGFPGSSKRGCVCGFVCFPHTLRNKTKNKKRKSRGGKVVLKGGDEAQIIDTLLDEVCSLAQDLTGREAGHSGCLRVKVEGGKSRTHKAQCPESLARVQPKIINC